ncbi:unnamed protein product [Macrosiphum euphorbiae]|uniref:Secreted protein n=1 Tax=Macrosiphum euphorbiae TaxID=13131 RepID=A0AAV0XPD4_9HEMI|nr:unnamed protein product [Macrosiphum euphorbiae]
MRNLVSQLTIWVFPAFTESALGVFQTAHGFLPVSFLTWFWGFPRSPKCVILCFVEATRWWLMPFCTLVLLVRLSCPIPSTMPFHVVHRQMFATTRGGPVGSPVISIVVILT